MEYEPTTKKPKKPKKPKKTKHSDWTCWRVELKATVIVDGSRIVMSEYMTDIWERDDFVPYLNDSHPVFAQAEVSMTERVLNRMITVTRDPQLLTQIRKGLSFLRRRRRKLNPPTG